MTTVVRAVPAWTAIIVVMVTFSAVALLSDGIPGAWSDGRWLGSLWLSAFCAGFIFFGVRAVGELFSPTRLVISDHGIRLVGIRQTPVVAWADIDDFVSGESRLRFGLKVHHLGFNLTPSARLSTSIKCRRRLANLGHYDVFLLSAGFRRPSRLLRLLQLRHRRASHRAERTPAKER